MKTKLTALLILAVLCVPTAVLAHKPLLTVEDNGDGTIYVETGFSDGSSGAGHNILLKDKESGDVLSEAKIPEGGYIEEIPMPDVPYTVTFDAGPGHAVVKDGPFSAETAQASEATQPEAAVEEEAAPEAVAESKPETAMPPEAAPAATSAPAQPVQVVQQPVAAQAMPVQMPMMTTAAATMSPGMERALNMMMTTQMVSALAVLVVLGAVMFLLGYVVGKDAGKTRA